MPRIHTGGVFSCCYSPNGEILATGGEDGKVIFWETGKFKRDPRYLYDAHRGSVNSTKFTKNGNFFLTASSDLSLKLWNVLDNYTRTTLLRSFIGHDDFVLKGDISRDSEYIASICNRTLRIWEPVKATLIKRIRNVETGNRALEFNPKGRYVVVAGVSGLIQVYDCKKLTYSRIYDIGNEIFQISFHPSGQFLACSLRYFYHRKNPVLKVNKKIFNFIFRCLIHWRKNVYMRLMG